MEGDAGASRLNPIDADETHSASTGAGETSSAGTGEDSVESESESVAEATQTEATEAADTAATEAADTAATDTEADADPGTEAEDSPEAEDPEPGQDDVERRPSRLNRAWLAGIAAVLILLAGGIAAGGYLALRADRQSAATARDNAAALKAAKDCIEATQAPDINTIAASEQKIIECGTDQYRTQALLYSSMLVQAYQAANVHLQVSDMRGAVERTNPDGTVDVLVALRVKVSNDQAQNQETGYRLRVRMTPMDGTYKISKLDQVTK